MRCKGRVTEWNDERGFGFAFPMSGGDRVFIHIKSFASRQRRPINGDIVVYELTRDVKGRLQGANVAISGAPPVSRATVGPGRVSLAFAALFLLAVTAAVVAGRLPLLALAFYVVASAITFAVYAWDKSAARNDRRRTPESTLHLLSLLGGWPGALVAQRTLRHKSKKRSFRYAFWGTVVLNCGAIILILFNSDVRIRGIIGVV